MRGRCRMAATRNGESVPKAKFTRMLKIVRGWERWERHTGAARDAHKGFAGLDDVDVSGGSLRRSTRSSLCRARDVSRNNEPLARPDLRRIADAVGLQDRRRRHAMLSGNAVDSFAIPYGDGRAAVPRPMTGRRRNGRCRSTDFGILTAR